MTQRWIALCLLTLALACASGCGTRVVYVRPGDPVRLREPIRNVQVWAYDGDGKLVPGTMRELPEGWWCLHDNAPLKPAR